MLDAQIVGRAASDGSSEKMELQLAAGGAVQKLALYHADGAGIPASVVTLAEQAYPGAKIKHYETEMYGDGERVWEVAVTTAEGKECELSATATALQYKECKLTEAELPKAVVEAVERIYPVGTIEKAESKEYANPLAAGVTVYALTVKSGSQSYYVLTSPDGGVLNQFRILTAKIKVELPSAAP
jgi:hypothetical protein